MYEWSYEYLVELPDVEQESCKHLDENTQARDVHNLVELVPIPDA
jgi:hypothetical protein